MRKPAEPEFATRPVKTPLNAPRTTGKRFACTDNNHENRKRTNRIRAKPPSPLISALTILHHFKTQNLWMAFLAGWATTAPIRI
jgi:hypothetical protein